MVAENYTHLTLVVDRSGSMGSLASSVSESINDLVREQASITDSEITISIVQFDTDFDTVEEFVPAQHVNDYELVPRGGTAMNDSVYRAIIDTRERINSMPEDKRPANVIITVATDGMENASREVTNAELKSLVEECETDGWSFVFLASNIDAKHTGLTYGIGMTRQMDHTAASYGASYATLSSTIATTRTTNKNFDQAWSDEESKTTDQ